MDISDNNMNQISVYQTKSRLTTYKRMFNIKKNKTNLISKKKLNQTDTSNPKLNRNLNHDTLYPKQSLISLSFSKFTNFMSRIIHSKSKNNKSFKKVA